MINEPAILSVLCDEPKGPVLRHVYPFRFSKESIQKFWLKASQFPTLFTDEIKGDFQKFCELFISDRDGVLEAHGLFWLVDDYVGIFSLTHITDVDASAHYSFFDKRQQGREELAKEMLRFVFRKYGFRRLSTSIPKYASRHTVGFVEALGFVQEGVKRKAAHYKDDWFDVRQFGILREEILTDADAI